MHDLAALERAGIPAVAMVSSGFRKQAAVQSSSLGYIGANVVFVQHPISDQTQPQMERKADDCFEDVKHALTSETFTTDYDSIDISRRTPIPVDEPELECKDES